MRHYRVRIIDRESGQKLGFLDNFGNNCGKGHDYFIGDVKSKHLFDTFPEAMKAINAFLDSVMPEYRDKFYFEILKGKDSSKVLTLENILGIYNVEMD